MYSKATKIQSSAHKEGIRANNIVESCGFMGTGFFAGIFAFIGLWRFWGDSQWGWFLGLVLISWYTTELVRQDFEAKGIDGANKPLALACGALQVAVIVRGIQSFWA